MPGKRDYYDVLGVPRTADTDAVKKAYRKLAIQLHPDRNKEADAEERFKEVSEAYAVLSDPEKKARYDQFGHAGIDQQYTSEDIFRGVDFGDIFGGDGGGFGSIFEQLFGMGGRRGGPRRGRDLQIRTAIDLADAFKGTETTLHYMRLEECKHCKGAGAEPGSQVDSCATCRGSGQVQRLMQTMLGTMRQVGPCPTCGGEGRTFQNPCSKCRGSGHERNRHDVTVTIPAGIESGQMVRAAGQGEVGSRGAPPGDLLVEVEIREHKRFHRDGPDLLLEESISIPQAVLGTKLHIETLDGDVDLDVPAGSATGKVITIRGRGMPFLRGTGRGDLHVRLAIEVPRKLSNRARELLEELEKELDGEPGKLGKKKRGLFG